jgi:hypothetical protein
MKPAVAAHHKDKESCSMIPAAMFPLWQRHGR